MAARRHPIQLKVTEAGYEPACEAAQKQHAKMKPGDIVGAEIARGRSVRQHRLYWSVLTKVVEHTGQWNTPEALHEVLKIETDHVEVVKLVSGRLIKIPESTAFDAMSQDRFQEYIDAAFQAIQTKLLDGMSVDQFMAEAEGGPSDMNAVAAILRTGNFGG